MEQKTINAIIFWVLFTILFSTGILMSHFWCYSYDRETLGEIHTKYESCRGLVK